VPAGVGKSIHEYAVDAGGVLLFERNQHLAAYWVASVAVQNRSIDGYGSGGNFTCVEYWFQPIFAVPLLHNGNASVEIDIQVLGLPAATLKPPLAIWPEGILMPVFDSLESCSG